MNLMDNYTKDSKNSNNTNELLDFMAGSAMIFSGFAITANGMKDKLSTLQSKIDDIQSQNIIEWHTISSVAHFNGLSNDAVLKRLKNGDFEEDADYKYFGSRIMVHQGAIGRLQRKRRSNNG